MNDDATCRVVPSEANGAVRLRRVEGGRQHLIKVKLDDTEYATIGERAAALKVSIQRFLVTRALRSPASAPAAGLALSPLIAELTGLRRLTANLANNINQIARALNSGASPASSIGAAADAVRRAMLRLDSILAVLAPDSSGGQAARSAAQQAMSDTRGSPRLAGPPSRIVPEAPS